MAGKDESPLQPLSVASAQRYQASAAARKTASAPTQVVPGRVTRVPRGAEVSVVPAPDGGREKLVPGQLGPTLLRR